MGTHGRDGGIRETTSTPNGPIRDAEKGTTMPATARHGWRKALRVCFTLLVALSVSSCDVEELLRVEDPDVVTPEQLSGPTAVPTVINGVVGDFHTSYNEFAWFTALFTDELLHGGTFTSWEATDQRDLSMDLTPGNWDETQVARQSAEDAIALFEENVGNPEFEDVSGLLQEGIAVGHFYGGYQHVLMAEFYCEMVIEEIGPVASPEEALQKGITMLEEAESVANEVGRSDLATAARIGRARANLQLGNYSAAADLVSGVPDDFLFVSEYSANTPQQENLIFQLSYGINAAVRASVGDGTQENRHNERWEYYDEWVDQGLVDPDPGIQAFESSVRVQAQRLHDRRGSNIHLASGWEARMIQAEALLRDGQVQAAEDTVNRLLTSSDQSMNPMSMITPNLSLGAFDPVDFTGNLQNDLEEMARARASGLWLSTDRQATLRRLKVQDGVDLYPDQSLGDAHCFPIPREEANTNPNVPG